MSTYPLLKDSHIESSEKICYEPPPGPSGSASQDYLIYFITGNPGSITYYRPFLAQLHSLLVTASDTDSARFHICGHSLRGFELGDDGPFGKPPQSPVSLQGQIDFQEYLLYRHVDSHRTETGNNPKVILMGHSVGAYILLELIQHHQKVIAQGEGDFDLIGGILLFPTITHIAKSPLGMVASKVLEIPYLPSIMGFLAKTLSRILPANLFYRLVRLITKFPDYAAEATTSFIKSPMGVRQALYLARDEMRTITEDRWDHEVWGTATTKGTNDRDTASWNLTLYWGQKDKWVANQTRDALIKARCQSSSQRQELKPVMKIDTEGMPHDFCTTLRNSHSVASKAKSWVDDIIETHKRAIS